MWLKVGYAEGVLLLKLVKLCNLSVPFLSQVMHGNLLFQDLGKSFGKSLFERPWLRRREEYPRHPSLTLKPLAQRSKQIHRDFSENSFETFHFFSFLVSLWFLISGVLAWPISLGKRCLRLRDSSAKIWGAKKVSNIARGQSCCPCSICIEITGNPWKPLTYIVRVL